MLSIPALHVAAMRRHGIQTIITADRHFDAVADMRRLDPASWTSLRAV